MPPYRNPDPPAESFWVTMAAIWVPLLTLLFWAQDAVPVGRLILLGIAFNVAVLLGLAYLRPEGRPDLAEQRRIAFHGFQGLVNLCAVACCVFVATAVAVLLAFFLPLPQSREARGAVLREILLVVSGLLFAFVRAGIERRLLALLARFAKRRAESQLRSRGDVDLR